MTVRKMFGRRTASRCRLRGFEKPVVGADDFIGKSDATLRRFAQIEMRSAFLLDADVENGLAVFATYGFQVRFDNSRNLIYFGLRVALGGRHPVTFAHAQCFADLCLGNFMESVEVENVHPQI